MRRGQIEGGIDLGHEVEQRPRRRRCDHGEVRRRAITSWLHGLPQEDLAILAGDPNASNERLAHPEPGLFFPTDHLLLPLIRFFGHSLKRFRNKEAGCRILAADYGLTESALKHIAMAYGQLPANREASHVPAA